MTVHTPELLLRVRVDHEVAVDAMRRGLVKRRGRWCIRVGCVHRVVCGTFPESAGAVEILAHIHPAVHGCAELFARLSRARIQNVVAATAFALQCTGIASFEAPHPEVLCLWIPTEEAVVGVHAAALGANQAGRVRGFIRGLVQLLKIFRKGGVLLNEPSLWQTMRRIQRRLN